LKGALEGFERESLWKFYISLHPHLLPHEPEHPSALSPTVSEAVDAHHSKQPTAADHSKQLTADHSKQPFGIQVSVGAPPTLAPSDSHGIVMTAQESKEQQTIAAPYLQPVAATMLGEKGVVNASEKGVVNAGEKRAVNADTDSSSEVIVIAREKCFSS
jgi:hypothetical protein